MLIRFVSQFTVHLCNAIYFLTTFSTPCKRFKKIAFCVLESKQSLNLSSEQDDMMRQWKEQSTTSLLLKINEEARAWSLAGMKRLAWLLNDG